MAEARAKAREAVEVVMDSKAKEVALDLEVTVVPGAMMTKIAAVEAGAEVAADPVVGEVPGAGAASTSLTESPGPASSTRRRSKAARRATGETSRMMSRWSSQRKKI